MRGNITDPSNLQAGQTYRVYEDGRIIEQVTLVIIEGDIGYIGHTRHDPLGRVELEQWVDDFSIVPHERASGVAETPPAPML